MFDFVTCSASRLEAKIDRLDAKLDKVLSKLEKLLMLAQELKDLIAKIDTATNTIASRIDALLAKITNSMSDADVAEVKSGLQAQADRLKTLGQDPDDPVPPSP